MLDALLLLAAVAANVTGMGWLALSMDVHWAQVLGDARSPPPRRTVALLRVAGAAALAASLALSLGVDHGSMASLVWVMAMAGAALCIALTLAWRPRTLGVLVPWVSATTDSGCGMSD
ncbi:DUF3325 domain-containing protein [Acidovorax sp. SUPP3334]|uniref:DUF3325 domain-containing protein n=1 Tax=Acidovorax sp. SUPP3334 TaxID=2920881 RepID=UPI0023DE4A15|nr:DUF3325 domain-containing protein [Acidovorax sp. SUPP3334]GKT20771.1 DUF3325 family protein [Acidovorax sp. SUPP3334]